MHSEEDDFYGMQPSASGLTLSHMNNKSSVLCPETQDITSQYLALQQLDAHQKMISRAKGCVDTSAPKSMQSYRSVTNRRKKLKQLKNESQISIQVDGIEEYKRPNSSRLTAYSSEEEEVESTNASFVNKAIQTGIPVTNITSKTAEKISWYLEALSLGELQSEYFAFLDSNSSMAAKFGVKSFPTVKKQKRVIKGDILDWHREHFIIPRKPFSPRILADTESRSKVRGMRCYNPPFRKKKTNSSHSSDTFESYDDEEENEEEISQRNENPKTSDNSSADEETLVSKRLPKTETPLYNSTTPLLPHYRRDYNNYLDPTVVNHNEEDKYLDFLSKVTEDILRSGVYSDKAIQQAFEFHLQFYKDDPNKEKLHSLLDQLLEGLKVTNDEEHFHQRNSFLFPRSRPSTPPEKETSAALFSSDTCRTANELNSSTVNESVDNINELNLSNS